MSPDPLVLLVDAPALPQGLDDALRREGCVVECVAVTQISGTLLISAPRVVVATKTHADEVSRAIRSSATQLDLPFLVLAPVGDIPRLRSQVGREVTALVADDVDASTLAIRVHATIRQAASKKARPRTLIGVAGLSTTAKVPSRRADEEKTQEFLFAPDDDPKTAEMLLSLAVAEDTERSDFLAGDAEVTKRSLLAYDDITDVDGKMIDDYDRTRVRDSDISIIAPALPPVLAPPPVPLPAPSGGPNKTSHSSPPGATAVHQWMDVKKPASAPPPSQRSEPSVQIGLPATEILKLRICVVDDDITRADALGRALRLEGQDVFLCSSRPASARWALLRQFAPQVLIMDRPKEASNTPEMTLALAKDPFLRDTPIVRHSLSALFDERTGKAKVGALDSSLAGHGRMELDLSTRLRAGEKVELQRSQINPGRLLSILGEVGRGVLVTSAHGDEVMTWKIAGAAAGTADVHSSTTAVTLTAKQALDHLLHRPSAHVALEARRDVIVPRGQSISELLEGAYQDHIPDFPGASSAGGGSFPPAARDPWSLRAGPSESLLSADSVVTVAPVPRPRGSTVPTFDAAFPEGASVTASSAPRAKRSPFLRTAAAVGLFGLGAGSAYVFGQVSAKSSDQPSNSAQAANPPEAEDGPTRQGTQEVTPPAPANTEPSATAAAPGTNPKDPAFWVPQRTTDAPSCEALLGQPASAFSGKPKWKAAHTLKLARQSLVRGQNEDAQKRLCESAFIDPKGGAPSSLAIYYLSERALDAAHDWAKRGVDARPSTSRREQELLGDALNQMGKLDEAKAIWLETLKLNADDEERLKKVAQTLFKSADTALRGGDSHLGERLLRRAAALNPDDARVAGALATALLRNDQAELAQRWANWTLSIDPESAEAYFVLGELAVRSNNKEEARLYFEKIPKSSKERRQAEERLRNL